MILLQMILARLSGYKTNISAFITIATGIMLIYTTKDVVGGAELIGIGTSAAGLRDALRKYQADVNKTLTTVIPDK